MLCSAAQPQCREIPSFAANCLMHSEFVAAMALSVDHKPNSDEERKRIENLGGVIVWAGTWRVGGVLAVSRAFGDRLLKKYVVATPHTQCEQLTSDDEVAILASDGLWDVMTNQDAIKIIKDCKVRRHPS